ncbi:MAG: DUF3108 domain-containing protein [Planctomycetota bacterium]
MYLLNLLALALLTTVACGPNPTPQGTAVAADAGEIVASRDATELSQQTVASQQAADLSGLSTDKAAGQAAVPSAAGDSSAKRQATEGTPRKASGDDHSVAPRNAIAAGAANQKATADKNKKTTAAKPIVPVGEQLVYRGTVRKAGVTVDVGKATFSVEQTDTEVILKAHAKGEKFGYSLDTSVTTRLRPGSIHPLIHEYRQKGSERRQKKLVFADDGATYWKVKHCKTPNCQDPKHMVKATTYAMGFIPWGSEKRHCTDSGCGHLEHRVWRLRKEHTLQQPHVDLLTAIYVARNLSFEPGAEPQVVPVISDRHLWNVKVSARSEKQLKIAAGTFDAVELLLEPEAADPKSTKKATEFDGLFGLNGAIKVWVEKSTRRPLLISGDLPFAFMNLHASIELVKITEEADAESAQPAAEVSPAAPDASKPAKAR